MSDDVTGAGSSEVENAAAAGGSGDDERLRGAVIVGLIPGQPARVVRKAAYFAGLMGAPLVVVSVDVTRFVTYEDPDGYVHSAPIDLHTTPGVDDIEAVRNEAAAALEGSDVDWSVEQLVGDPALAMKHLADRIDARLLVVGTRRRGIGESIREFFTGSVAARLAHRQHRPVLVVPLGDPVPDDEEIEWGEEL
jgi:nucleotide-binding universal stress UspA family protein